jgi:hypothetical protein
MARSRIGEQQVRDTDFLSEAEHNDSIHEAYVRVDGTRAFYSTASYYPFVTIENENDNNSAARIRFIKTSNSVVGGDALGIIQWHSTNTSGTDIEYASYKAQIVDPDQDQEAGSHDFWCYVDAENVPMLRMYGYGNNAGGQIQMNSGGKDIDLRVDGIDVTNIIRTDAGTGRLGVGTFPAYPLHVLSNQELSSGAYFYFDANNSSTDADADVMVIESARANTASEIAILRVRNATDHNILYVSGDSKVGINSDYTLASLHVEKDTGGTYDDTTIAAFFGHSNVGQSDNTYIIGNTINFGLKNNSNDVAGWLNYRSYNAGVTRTRDLIVGDGKGAQVARFYGASKNIGMNYGLNAPYSCVAATNTTSGTNATTQFRAVNNNSTGASFGIGSTGYTALSLLNNRGYVYTDSSSYGLVFMNAGNEPIIFATNGNTERARITSYGLGIGGTEANSARRVNIEDSRSGTIAMSVTNTSTASNALAGFQALNDNYQTALFGIGGSNYSTFANMANRAFIWSSSGSDGIVLVCDAADPIIFEVNASEAMRIHSDGNVGIGGTPSYKFDVQGATGAVARIYGENSSGDVTTYFWNNGDSNQASSVVLSAIQGGRYGGRITFGRLNANDWSANINNADSFIALSPAINGVDTEVVRISALKVVGINNTDPNDVLHINEEGVLSTPAIQFSAGNASTGSTQYSCGRIVSGHTTDAYSGAYIDLQYPTAEDTFTTGLKLTTTHVSLEIGVLRLKETTTPSADSGYGKIYTKDDNELYFQDGAGTEHTVDVDGGGTSASEEALKKSFVL